MRVWLHRHYHWIIALAMLLQLAVYTGIGNNFNSLFVLPVTQGLNISRSSFSLALSLRQLISFACTMISGALFMPFGYRKLAMIALPLTALAYMVLSMSQNAAMIAIGAGMIGFCDAICSTAGATRVVNDWFHRHRGTVLGAVSAFTGVGGSLICILLTDVMDGSGWRGAYRCCGILVLAVAVLVVLLVRNRPEQMGLRPFGEGELPKKKRHGAVTEDHWPGFSMGELVRKPTFYLMLLCTLLGCMLCYFAFYTIVPHLQDQGLSSSEAAYIQSLMLMALTAAKLICGFLIDRIGARWVTGICIACGAVGSWLLASATSMNSALLAIGIYTCSLSLTTITIPLLATRLFGFRAHGTAVGIFLSMVSVGGMLASPLINGLYDLMGSYVPAYRGAAVGLLVVLGLYLLLFALAEKDRARRYAQQTGTGST